MFNTQFLRHVFPPNIWSLMSNTYWLRLKDVDWYHSNEGRTSIQCMRSFKNKHRSERCFIIGNGPSLNKLDLSRLKNEYTFGLNRIYLLFPELGFTTTYFIALNQLVIEQCVDDIQNLSIPKFLSWKSRNVIGFDTSTIFFRPMSSDVITFSKTPEFGLCEGATVTYIAMQLAYYMGFQKVILIGVDHNFVTKGPAHKAITSEGPDPNHFHGNYFGKGFRWQLPDLETSERAYHLARKTYESDGREIVDATLNGKLQVFPKTAYNTLF